MTTFRLIRTSHGDFRVRDDAEIDMETIAMRIARRFGGNAVHVIVNPHPAPDTLILGNARDGGIAVSHEMLVFDWGPGFDCWGGRTHHDEIDA